MLARATFVAHAKTHWVQVRYGECMTSYIVGCALFYLRELWHCISVSALLGRRPLRFATYLVPPPPRCTATVEHRTGCNAICARNLDIFCVYFASGWIPLCLIVVLCDHEVDTTSDEFPRKGAILIYTYSYNYKTHVVMYMPLFVTVCILCISIVDIR